jgi:hypothetical protein
MQHDDGTLTAVDRELIKRRRRRWIVIAIIAVLGLVAYSAYRQVIRIDVAVKYDNDEDHFKYGSIGTDKEGLPYWIWKTMPEVCSSLLPGGYASLGVIQEPGKDTPIGFSKRRVGPLVQVGPNCGLCHSASVRRSAADAAMTYLTAPAHQLDLEGYFRFLFACSRDPNFTTENFTAAIEKHTDLSLVDKLI